MREGGRDRKRKTKGRMRGRKGERRKEGGGRRGKEGEARERRRQRMVLWNAIWKTWIVFSEVLCPINIYVGTLACVLHPGESGVGILDCSVEHWNTCLSIWGDGRSFKP